METILTESNRLGAVVQHRLARVIEGESQLWFGLVNVPIFIVYWLSKNRRKGVSIITLPKETKRLCPVDLIDIIE